MTDKLIEQKAASLQEGWQQNILEEHWQGLKWRMGEVTSCNSLMKREKLGEIRRTISPMTHTLSFWARTYHLPSSVLLTVIYQIQIWAESWSLRLSCQLTITVSCSLKVQILLCSLCLIMIIVLIKGVIYTVDSRGSPFDCSWSSEKCCFPSSPYSSFVTQ